MNSTLISRNDKKKLLIDHKITSIQRERVFNEIDLSLFVATSRHY